MSPWKPVDSPLYPAPSRYHPPSMTWAHWPPVPMSCFASTPVLLHPGVQSPELGTPQPASPPLAAPPEFTEISFRGLQSTCREENERRESPGRVIQMTEEEEGVQHSQERTGCEELGRCSGKARPAQARLRGPWVLLQREQHM